MRSAERRSGRPDRGGDDSEGANTGDIAVTTTSALDAFRHDDGGFGMVEFILCQNAAEAGHNLEALVDSWILYMMPGATLERDTFRVLGIRKADNRTAFLSPYVFNSRRTETGVNLNGIGASALFGTLAHFKGKKASKTALRLVS